MDVEVVAGEIIEEDLSEAPTGEEKNAQGKSREKKRNPGERKSMTKKHSLDALHLRRILFWLSQAAPGFARKC